MTIGYNWTMDHASLNYRELHPSHYRLIDLPVDFAPNQLQLLRFPMLTDPRYSNFIGPASIFFATQFFSDSDTRQYLRHGTPQTPDEVATRFFGRTCTERMYYYFIIATLYNSPEAILGFANLCPTDIPSIFETGTLVHKKYWRRGIGLWARTQIIAIASSLGATDLISVVREDNLPSINLTKKLGFETTNERRIDPTAPVYLQKPNRLVFHKSLVR